MVGSTTREKLHSLLHEICSTLYTGSQQHIVYESDHAYIRDEMFDLVRLHPIADLVRSMTTLGNCGWDISTEALGKLTQYLLDHQNSDGSFNEIYTHYNRPSTLNTALVSEALLHARALTENETITTIAQQAFDYIRGQEVHDGYFRKSAEFHANTLNVSSAVASFVSMYLRHVPHPEAPLLLKRAIGNVLTHQFPSGAYPYTAPGREEPYKYHLNIECIYYQGVVLYYLLKTLENIQELIRKNPGNEEHYSSLIVDLRSSLTKGTRWLADQQQGNGAFRWDRSGFVFPLFLNAGYAFAINSFTKSDDEFMPHALHACMYLNEQFEAGRLWKLERSRWSTLPSAVINALQIAPRNDYPFYHILFRAAHVMYLECARRRIVHRPNDHASAKWPGAKGKSTVIPLVNYHDLAAELETLNYLSDALYWLENGSFSVKEA